MKTESRIWNWDKLTTETGEKWEGGSNPFRKDLPAGTWGWNKETEPIYLEFTCPCGCGITSLIPVTRKQGGYGWYWDGNEDNPTLTPSIQKLTPCRWHGWLRGGEFKSV